MMQPLRLVSGPVARRVRSAPRGFTLIEILIVISIIALLSSFVLVAVNQGRKGASEAITRTQVEQIAGAVERYFQDEATYPAMDLPTTERDNHFPALYDAILGEARPHGKGGRSAPYIRVKEDQIGVWDEDVEEYRLATREEIADQDTKKYMLDSWGNPYVYRCNKGRKKEAWMHNSDYDVYSLGQNGKDDTGSVVVKGAEDEEEEETGEKRKDDDIGNW
jgi:prepilin-type N-terminal cleavage/methylation domain-containing protein